MRNSGQPLIGRFRLLPGILVAVALAQVVLADAEEGAASPAALNPAPEAVAAPLSGRQVYNEVCVACHTPPGFGGAPALGDSDAWAARLDSGVDTLIEHALNGYSGSTGIMPKKGGRNDLSDAEIVAAVEFMVEQATP